MKKAPVCSVGRDLRGNVAPWTNASGRRGQAPEQPTFWVAVTVAAPITGQPARRSVATASAIEAPVVTTSSTTISPGSSAVGELRVRRAPRRFATRWLEDSPDWSTTPERCRSSRRTATCRCRIPLTRRSRAAACRASTVVASIPFGVPPPVRSASAPGPPRRPGPSRRRVPTARPRPGPDGRRAPARGSTRRGPCRPPPPGPRARGRSRRRRKGASPVVPAGNHRMRHFGPDGAQTGHTQPNRRPAAGTTPGAQQQIGRQVEPVADGCRDPERRPGRRSVRWTIGSGHRSSITAGPTLDHLLCGQTLWTKPGHARPVPGNPLPR